MTDFHRYIGLALAGLFLLIFFWAVVSWFRNKHPGPWFWRSLAVAQIALAGPALTGAILFLIGNRPHILHFAYGAFPILVLVAAHRLSKRFEGLEWALFGIAGLVNFGLLVRGFMTGGPGG